jgi:hypothetical protein
MFDICQSWELAKKITDIQNVKYSDIILKEVESFSYMCTANNKENLYNQKKIY